MKNLHQLQERIHMIQALLQQVDALQPKAADRLMGNQAATAYNTEEVTKLQYQIAQWGLETYNIAIQAVGNENPSLQYFHKRWRTPLPGLNLKAELTKKLHNARTDLSILIQETQDKQLAQTTYTNLWELTHPEIETKTKTMVDQGNYTQALEQAIKTLTGTIARENKPQHHSDSVLALLLTTNTATLTQEKTMRLLLIASEMMYRIENE